MLAIEIMFRTHLLVEYAYGVLVFYSPFAPLLLNGFDLLPDGAAAYDASTLPTSEPKVKIKRELLSTSLRPLVFSRLRSTLTDDDRRPRCCFADVSFLA